MRLFAIQRFGVLFAPSPAGSKEGAPAPSPEVGGPGFGYAGRELALPPVPLAAQAPALNILNVEILLLELLEFCKTSSVSIS